jgi:hypothetical protein
MEPNKSILDRYSREEKLGFGQRLRFEFSLLQLDDPERGLQNEKPLYGLSRSINFAPTSKHQAEKAKLSWPYLVGFGRISLDLDESQLGTSSRLLQTSFPY